jgi:hypothetical protein
VGIFGRRQDKPGPGAGSPARAADPVPMQREPVGEPQPAGGAAPDVVPAGDLQACDIRLKEWEQAYDLNQSPRVYRAAMALAVAGGYPDLNGKDMMLYRVREIDKGNPYEETDRRPWQWLAGVAETALGYGYDGQLLAARVAFMSVCWQEDWAEEYSNRICKSASLGQQYQEEVGLIPPPDDLYASVVSSGIIALDALKEGLGLVRPHWAREGQAYTAQSVLVVVSQAAAGLQNRGAEVSPRARAVAGAVLQAKGQD